MTSDPISRDAAWALLTAWTQSESLRKHALAVEAAVRGYARTFGEDEEGWAVVALLHDFDYERYPSLTDHPFRGCEELQRRGYPEWVTRAILSHADYSGVSRDSLLEKTLYACDEMAGFVTAAALVRPSRSILDLEAQSVIKRMKDKAFARAVNRDDLRRGAEELGLPHDRIVISCKVSGVQDLISVYRNIAARCDYPLHLGLTEAGMGAKGIVSSTAALAILLQEGIGDTIRVSLTPEPGGDRRQEVRVAQEVLQSLGLRAFAPRVVACPGCGRTTSSYFQELAQRIQEHVRERMPAWRREYVGAENMTVAVMGCVVNGPGESKHANIGISLPGTGERPVAPVYVDGEKGPTLKGERIAEEFQQLVEQYVERKYRAGSLR